MNKTIIKSNRVPAAIGPYSAAVKTGNLIFLSGQLPVDMSTGNLELSDIRRSTVIIMENISKFLEENGLTTANIVKTSVFLNNMEEFSAFNEEYAKFFEKDYPARECVQVARLPKDVKIEISAIISE